MFCDNFEDPKWLMSPLIKICNYGRFIEDIDCSKIEIVLGDHKQLVFFHVFELFRIFIWIMPLHYGENPASEGLIGGLGVKMAGACRQRRGIGLTELEIRPRRCHHGKVQRMCNSKLATSTQWTTQAVHAACVSFFSHEGWHPNDILSEPKKGEKEIPWIVHLGEFLFGKEKQCNSVDQLSTGLSRLSSREVDYKLYCTLGK